MKVILTFGLFVLMFFCSNAMALTGHWEAGAERHYNLRVRLEHSFLPSGTAVISNSGDWNELLINQRESLTGQGAIITVNDSIWADIIVYKMPLMGRLIVTLETLEGKVLSMYDSNEKQLVYSPLEEHDFLCEFSAVRSSYGATCDGVTAFSQRLSILVGFD